MLNVYSSKRKLKTKRIKINRKKSLYYELIGIRLKKLADELNKNKFKNDLLKKEFNFYGNNDIVEQVKDRVKDVEYLRLSDFLKKDIILPFPYDYENSDTTLQEHITELESKPRSIYVNSNDGYNVAFSVNKNLNYVLSFMLGRNILVGNNEYAAYDELSQDMQAKIKSIRVRIKYTENLSDNIIQDFCKVKQHKPKNTRKPLFIY